jgi:hypothetical protein
MQKEQRIVIVKTIQTDPHGKQHPDYQMLQIPHHKTDKALKQEILDHIMSHHPGYLISIDIYDPDNLPKGAIPDGMTFSLPID